MLYNILLLVAASCLLDLTNTDENNDNNQIDYVGTQGVGVWCWECTVEKSMDNNVKSMYDEVTHSRISTGQCTNYQCASGLDWCLVTYFRVWSKDGVVESKRERYECGNKEQRKADTRCQQLLREDNDHNVIYDCTTKRAGASSIYTVYLSAFLAAVLLYVH